LRPSDRTGSFDRFVGDKTIFVQYANLWRTRLNGLVGFCLAMFLLIFFKVAHNRVASVTVVQNMLD